MDRNAWHQYYLYGDWRPDLRWRIEKEAKFSQVNSSVQTLNSVKVF
jgi:hypothetical protein